MELKHPKGMSTHMAVLIKTIMKSEGSVVEIGAGYFSTPLLHWLTKMTNKKLVTYENNDEYYALARKFLSKHHSVRLIKNWDEMDFKTHRGVVFVDHAPKERRIVDIMNFKDIADYIVIHDTERDLLYGYDKIWPHFKYRFDWQECVPYTSVVSNFYPLDFLKHEEPLHLH